MGHRINDLRLLALTLAEVRKHHLGGRRQRAPCFIEADGSDKGSVGGHLHARQTKEPTESSVNAGTDYWHPRLHQPRAARFHPGAVEFPRRHLVSAGAGEGAGVQGCGARAGRSAMNAGRRGPRVLAGRGGGRPYALLVKVCAARPASGSRMCCCKEYWAGGGEERRTHKEGSRAPLPRKKIQPGRRGGWGDWQGPDRRRTGLSRAAQVSWATPFWKEIGEPVKGSNGAGWRLS
jgi:hypothetical protein